MLPHEWGPSWVKLDIGPPSPGAPAWTSPAGASHLQDNIQAAMDGLQAQDTAWALAAASSSAQDPIFGLWMPMHQDGVVSTDQHRAQEQQGAPAQQQQEQDRGQHKEDGSGAEERWSQWSVEGSSQDHSVRALHDRGTARELLAAAVGRALGGNGELLAAVMADPASMGLSRLTRLLVRLDRVLTDETSALRPAGSAVALFEICAEPLKWQVSLVFHTQSTGQQVTLLCRRLRLQPAEQHI